MNEARQGRINAELIRDDGDLSSPDLIDIINRNIHPPTAVGAEDVFIRAMYVASDEVNSFGGRFPVDELENLARLICDSPVMVGHRKDRLPVARNFHAVVVTRNGRPWVKSYFYWLKESAQAESLRGNIDGGIYKECSIGFTFYLAECSICGEDIRNCDHQLFQSYARQTIGSDENDKSETSDRDVCHFNYRRVERVLETSLVFRGALPGTSLTNELTAIISSDNDAGQASMIEPDRETVNADSPTLKSLPSGEIPNWDNSQRYYVMPFYDGIEYRAACLSSVLSLERIDGGSSQIDPAARLSRLQLTDFSERMVLLVGCRGRKRCSALQLKRFLDGLSTEVTRLELKLYPLPDEESSPTECSDGRDRVAVIRHLKVSGGGVIKAAKEIMTSDGVRLWTSDSDPSMSSCIHISARQLNSAGQARYSLNLVRNGEPAFLTISEGNRSRTLKFKNLNLSLLMRGRRFIAGLSNSSLSTGNEVRGRILEGAITGFERKRDGIIVDLRGNLSGRFVLRPVRLNGHHRCLFYRKSDKVVQSDRSRTGG